MEAFSDIGEAEDIDAIRVVSEAIVAAADEPVVAVVVALADTAGAVVVTSRSGSVVGDVVSGHIHDDHHSVHEANILCVMTEIAMGRSHHFILSSCAFIENDRVSTHAPRSSQILESIKHTDRT